jgi:mannose/cellobiose epimerase-like protein (N-acyl-D-glucosamine 2-epimerase family)
MSWGIRRFETALILGIALFMAGCDAGRVGSQRIDTDWHRVALLDGLLARWVEVAPSASGAMRSAVDRRWVAAPEQSGYLTEQARLVYSFAIGYELTRDKRYLDAAQRGANFLLTHFRDPLHGGFFTRVGADGRVIHAAKNTYGHAFVLFALSHMYRVSGDERYKTEALRAWQDIDIWLRDPQGGFRGELPRDFSQAGQARGATSQNPIMHLFEALLALHDATRDPVALTGAKNIAEFVVYRLLVGLPDGGAYIPEWYDHEWKPLPTRDKGGYTDLGHQFEWSHMLRAAEIRGLVGIYGQTADRVLKFATKVGYDEINGGVFTRVYPDGTLQRDKHWWQQCEAMRAFLAVSMADEQPDMWRRYEQTLGLVREQFIDKNNGGWFPKACPRGDCSDTQPEPYHMTSMHAMALAMAAATTR